jgi:hypothetical protein
VRCLSRRRYLRRPEGRRGIGRIDSLGSFSESDPAALLASFFSVRAGNVSFLEKRPPWPGLEVSTTSFHEVSYEVTRVEIGVSRHFAILLEVFPYQLHLVALAYVFLPLPC